MASVSFSSPGKALIAGGYLVLDPSYDSYVTALSSRMHAVVRSADPVTGNGRSDTRTISIESPQFEGGKWVYECGEEIRETNGKTNPFLESVVTIVTKYVEAKLPYNIQITIFSDPGFHTQQNTSSKSSTNGSHTFLYHSEPITEVAKTGLGSSACLTSVVTAALISQLQPSAIDNKSILHNLAQISHCKAQGKIGSGFDVATAIYGSIKYRRFKPELVNEYLQDETQDLKSLVDLEWDFVHEGCSLPPHIRLLMGDIEGGSETPKLVSTVLKWRKENHEEALQLYTNLNNANVSLIEALNELHGFYKSNRETYLEAIKHLKTVSINSAHVNNSYQPFFNLIDSVKQIRKYLKELTVKSGATIEPESQTTLLDNCNNLRGCLGGVVPGAGGYDAISLLVIDDAIENIVQHTKTDKSFGHVTWLNLQEQAEGLIKESVSDYQGLYLS